jgi:hypothetical protein
VEQIVAHRAAWAKAGSGARKRYVNWFPCSLIYRIDDDLIRIVAVMHQRQRPGDWRSR